MTLITAPLVGMRHHPGAPEALELLGFGDPIVLVREPTNAYDENAIQVFTISGTLLGYIAREYAAEWAPHFDSSGVPDAHLTFGSEGRPRVEIEFGDEEEPSSPVFDEEEKEAEEEA